MVSYVSALLYGVGGLVVAGMALLVAFQERLVYVPALPGLTKSYAITPSRLRLVYEDVWLRSSDGVRLHSWFIKLFPDCRGLILLFLRFILIELWWILLVGFRWCGYVLVFLRLWANFWFWNWRILVLFCGWVVWLVIEMNLFYVSLSEESGVKWREEIDD